MKIIAFLSVVVGAIALGGCNQDAKQSSVATIACDEKILDQSFGFNENVEASTCESLKVFGMQDYQCSVESNVFGTTLSAAHLTTDSKSVYAFANAEQCIEGLKKWIELVP